MAETSVDEVKVEGAGLTFTVSAIIEGLYFGLLLLIFPGAMFNLLSTIEATSVELYFMRIIGMLALALGVGCWYARSGHVRDVRLMSVLMMIAKIGSTIILVALMIAVDTMQLIGWINPLLTAILALLNVRQYQQLP